MSHLFIITSAINSHISVIPIQERYNDTFQTIESIRKKVPDSIIVLAESSPQIVPEEYLKELSTKVDYTILTSQNPNVVQLGLNAQKSPAECYSLFLSIDFVESLGLPGIQRVFKLTGRGKLTDDFDIEYYNKPEVIGKFVYKKRVQSWMSKEVFLVDTRISSFCYSILPEAKEMMKTLVNHCLQTGRDVEHCTFELIDKSKLIEKDILGYECRISSTGEFRYD
jgi:hypothetical protein